MDSLTSQPEVATQDQLSGGGIEEISFNPNSVPDTPPTSTETQGGSGIASATIPTQTQTQQPAATETPQMVSIRDAARQLGYELPEFADDQQALIHLLNAQQSARQNDFYTQIGRQIAPNYQQVQQYIAQQRQQQQPQQTGPKPWERPEWDDRWTQMVERDPATGAYVAKPGVNPAIAEKVQAFADWTGRFQRDPLSVIQPWFEEQVNTKVTQQVQQIVQQQFGQVAEQQTISSIMQGHSAWLYAKDASGNPVRDRSGKLSPSPAGVRYIQHLQDAAQMGIRGSNAQDSYAIRQLRADVAEAQLQRGQAPTPNPQAVHRPNVNPGQALVEPTRRGIVPGSTEPAPSGKSLAQLLREGLDAEGVTDADFLPVG